MKVDRKTNCSAHKRVRLFFHLTVISWSDNDRLLQLAQSARLIASRGNGPCHSYLVRLLPEPRSCMQFAITVEFSSCDRGVLVTEIRCSGGAVPCCKLQRPPHPYARKCFEMPRALEQQDPLASVISSSLRESKRWTGHRDQRRGEDTQSWSSFCSLERSFRALQDTQRTAARAADALKFAYATRVVSSNSQKTYKKNLRIPTSASLSPSRHVLGPANAISERSLP